ncbi:DegT/DnrJ/EryC1/StrS family aminotransferase [Candidatus Sumerlaeota bacterium]|nr:DegT/DnrJ/EryC1/StrS family aminotransferase [Candidatus Sumerlaeota bacterium]
MVDDLRELRRALAFRDPIHVTRPTLPGLDQFRQRLEPVWRSHWLTNDGPFHRELEERLSAFLGVEHLSLMCNGTIALLMALQALEITHGEVITTPFTFPATTHVIHWNRLEPVFCDIEPRTFNIDAQQIEHHIGPRTRAILAVHVFGNPCDVKTIDEIARRHRLHVIHDASHAFGVELEGRSVLTWGDLSTLSFHATKLYSTIEGGGVVASTPEQKRRLDFLKNFGIADEETVIGPGVNGKLNELQAIFGLLTLEGVREEIDRRLRITEIYRGGLRDIPGVTVPRPVTDVRHNGAYFPILVDRDGFGMDRDALYRHLKLFNIHTRKYFHPLCSHFPCYASLPSADPLRLPVAERVDSQVLCLPIFGTLPPDHAVRISEVIRQLQGRELTAADAALH